MNPKTLRATWSRFLAPHQDALTFDSLVHHHQHSTSKKTIENTAKATHDLKRLYIVTWWCLMQLLINFVLLFVLFFFSFSNSFHFSLVAMMKEGRCSCEVLWLLLLISMYFMEFVIRLLVIADLVSFFFFFVTFFQLPQSLHSCKLSSPWLVHSASIIETPQTTKSGRPGISANWSNALWGGGGGVERRASWFDYLENATRGVFFFFLILEPKNNGGIVVYLHLPFPTKRAVWDGNV